MCLAQGQYVPATCADHIVPHRGDPDVFWFGALQSLCHPCHNSTKRFVEARGHSNEIGLNGLPIDPKHPFYTGKLAPQT